MANSRLQTIQNIIETTKRTELGAKLRDVCSLGNRPDVYNSELSAERIAQNQANTTGEWTEVLTIAGTPSPIFLVAATHRDAGKLKSWGATSVKTVYEKSKKII